jgi:LysR family glycine cleavage system transcriptional activator
LSRRLPPLNALRAFEAAGRHLSFTKAAEELNVTQAAISHQVKALEERLGVTLFRRRNRALLLTDTGQAYLPVLREAFDAIAEGTERIVRREDRGPLKISVLPSFAAKWLLPRLPLFNARHPDIDILVSASSALVDFERDEVDLAIRYGRGDYPGLHVEFLFRDQIYPVCSPRLLETKGQPSSPEDLKHFPLLHDDADLLQEGPSWNAWFKEVGAPGIGPPRGLGYSDSSMAVQAAIEGQGIALARSSIAGDDLASGRLVRLFDFEVSSSFAYYLALPARALELPKVEAFRDWLIVEICRDPLSGCAPAQQSIDKEAIEESGA